MEPERPQTPSKTDMASEAEVEVDVNQDLPWNQCVMGCTSSPDSPLILLKCLHALCSDACLAKLKEELPEGRNLHCKTCRVCIQPEDLEKRFTPSKTLRKKLSLKDLEEVMKCGYCVKQRPAVAYCETCPLYLCGRCHKIHAEAVTTHTHKPNTNLEDRITIELELLRKSLRKCDPHKNESIEFCFTCQAKVCDLEDCRAAHGEGHEMFVISEEEEKLPSKLDTLSKLMGRLDEIVASLKAKHESVMGEEWVTFLHLINTEFDRIAKILIARLVLIKREGRNLFHNRMRMLAYNRIRMEKWRSRAAVFRDTLTNVSTGFDEMSTIKFSLLAKSTESHLQNFAKTIENVDELTEKDMHFILNFKAEPVSFETLISNFGSVNYTCDPTYKPIPFAADPSPPGITDISRRILGSRTITLDDSANTETTTEGDESTSDSPHGELGEPSKVVQDVEQRQSKSSGAEREQIGPGGIPLGMPQLLRSSSSSNTSTPPSIPLPAPPTVSCEKPALKTYSSSKAGVLSDKPVQETSVSQSESEATEEKAESSPKKKQKTLGQRKTDCGVELEPHVITSTKASPELISSSEANPTDGQKVSGDSENTPQESCENRDDQASDEEKAPSLDNGLVNREEGSGGNFRSVTPRKNDEEEPEMPLLTPYGPVRKRRRSLDRSDDVPKPLEDIKPDVITPTTSSAIADTSVRTSGRERKKKVFPDCVNLEQRRFSKKEERVDSSQSTPAPSTSSIPRLRRKSALPPETHLGPPSEPPTKLTRVVSKGDDVPSIKTVEPKKELSEEVLPLPQVKREVVSENGLGDGSGSEGSSSSRRLSLRRRPDPEQGDQKPAAKRTNGEIDVSAFPEAPRESMEEIPVWCDYPIQGTRDKMKTSEEDSNEDYCCICLDGGEDVIVCCDFCPKVFHLGCHIPPLTELPDDEDIQWHCNFDKTMEDIDKEIGEMEVIPGADELPLTDANPAAYLRASKFMMEVYKITEVPVIKWKFPEKYLEKYDKVPYHLKFLREKLCLSGAEGVTAFQSVREYMEAFKQLFTQAFLIYKQRTSERRYALACFKKFRDLVDEYYPDYQELFDQV